MRQFSCPPTEQRSGLDETKMRQLVLLAFVCCFTFGNVRCAGQTPGGAHPPGIQPARVEDLDPELDPTCTIAVTGKNGKCRQGYCLSTQLAIDGGQNDVYCMCSKDQFLTATGCDNKLSRRRSQGVRRPKRQTFRLTKTSGTTGRRSSTGRSSSGDLEVLRGQSFAYPKRNLLGLYLTVSMSECIDLCRSFEARKRNKRSSEHCGSIVVHQHESMRFVCEVVSSKPVKRCERFLESKRSFSTAYLKPLLQDPNSCH